MGPDKTITLTSKQQRLLGYALVFLITNYDDDNEEDLEMTQEQMIEEAVKTSLVEWNKKGTT